MMEEDLKKVEKVVLISAIVLVLIGIVEILVGYYTNSVGLLADGTDSISDSVISFMVWFGIRISRKKADKKFNFGYYRVETLVSMIVA
ncbi:MAG: cation diffusion facilitator family transporter, partial [Nanoarchaeota archaeon]